MTRTARHGLTLIEVLIVIAILAIALSIIYPNVVPPRDPVTQATEGGLIDQAKAMAIARAEPMRLSVGTDGTWHIVAEAAVDARPLASGQLPEAPARAWALRVTELGSCYPADPSRQVEGPVVDAVSCTVRP